MEKEDGEEEQEAIALVLIKKTIVNVCLKNLDPTFVFLKEMFVNNNSINLGY